MIYCVKKIATSLKKLVKEIWKKALIVFGGIGAIFSFISAFGVFNELPSVVGIIILCSFSVLGIIITVLWHRLDSAKKVIIYREPGTRVATEQSVRCGPDDITHHYSLIHRHDLLDYGASRIPASNGRRNGCDYVSIRILKGSNVSKHVSNGLTYVECTEYRSSCKDILIEAYDFKTWKPLKVEFIDRADNQLYYDFPFKIWFSAPLPSGEEFAIVYKITLRQELDVLGDDDEIMSVSLTRYRRGVDKLVFNVSLNFEPRYTHIEYKKDPLSNRFDLHHQLPKVVQYIPQEEHEVKFDINWSSSPYVIKWECDNPKWKLYAANYRK